MNSICRTSPAASLSLVPSVAGGASAPARADTAGAAALPCCTAVARIWRSVDLLGSHNEIQIDHHGALYRLRVTALGKLILTK